MKKVSIIIPAYNEEENIARFFDLAKEFLMEDFSYQYIFVDDGSEDRTSLELKKLVENNPDDDIVTIHFSRNFGKESAILAGLRYAEGDYISLIDADMQQHPRYVNEMLDLLENNPDLDMVACYQEKRKESCLLTFFKSLFYSSINRMSDVNFEKNVSDFRSFRKEVGQAIQAMPEYNRFSKGLFSWVGFQTAYIPYKVEERKYGKTSWSFIALLRYAFEGYFGFSIAPLKMATFLGLITSLAALLYFLFTLIKTLVNGIDIPGYASIVSLILLLSGVQLISLGIIGEYLGRTYLESKHRPKYLIKKIHRTKNKDVEK